MVTGQLVMEIVVLAKNAEERHWEEASSSYQPDGETTR